MPEQTAELKGYVLVSAVGNFTPELLGMVLKNAAKPDCSEARTLEIRLIRLPDKKDVGLVYLRTAPGQSVITAEPVGTCAADCFGELVAKLMAQEPQPTDIRIAHVGGELYEAYDASPP